MHERNIHVFCCQCEIPWSQGIPTICRILIGFRLIDLGKRCGIDHNIRPYSTQSLSDLLKLANIKILYIRSDYLAIDKLGL